MHSRTSLSRFFCAVVTIVSSACAARPSGAPPLQALNGAVQIEAHLSRTSLTETEYEQFKYFDGQLYKECGQSKRGRAVMKEQDLVALDNSLQQNLERVAHDFVNVLRTYPNSELDAPGKNADLFDPGRAIFTVRIGERNFDVQTSVTALDGPRSRVATETLRLARTIRNSAGGDLCGHKTFFGIPGA
jgi:hypothetical protein